LVAFGFEAWNAVTDGVLSRRAYERSADDQSRPANDVAAERHARSVNRIAEKLKQPVTHVPTLEPEAVGCFSTNFDTIVRGPSLHGVLADLVVCPVCKEPLEDATCTRCGRTYAVKEGALDLTPVPPPDQRVQARWPLWEELQLNGNRAYEIDPPANLSVGERADADAFASFSDLRGVVLDVGCGTQALPSYGRGVDGRLVGIDPLRGARDRAFEFVQGLAEFLPFRDRVFDRVLFATSIDHVLVPELALAEAYRVASRGGTVCIWLGEIAPPGLLTRLAKRIRPPRHARFTTPRGQVKFAIPEGAVDAFHVAHLDADTISRWLERAGFSILDVERPFRANCFIRAFRKS
jgi:ubiquinone/menaquinone biosynthesis C-methylase UbiE